MILDIIPHQDTGHVVAINSSEDGWKEKTATNGRLRIRQDERNKGDVTKPRK